MLAGSSGAEPQRVCAPPVAASGASPGQPQTPRPRTRSDRAASAAPPAGWLRLAHHLPAALRLALAVEGPSRLKSSGRDEDAGQGGAGAARAAAATAMRHLAHVQHIAALLTAAAPPPAAPAAGWDKELEGRGAPAGGFFAVLGALNAARAGDAACGGGDSHAAGAREDALLGGMDGWRERARVCKVRGSMQNLRCLPSTAHAPCKAPPQPCLASAQDLSMCTWRFLPTYKCCLHHDLQRPALSHTLLMLRSSFPILLECFVIPNP